MVIFRDGLGGSHHRPRLDVTLIHSYLYDRLGIFEEKFPPLDNDKNERGGGGGGVAMASPFARARSCSSYSTAIGAHMRAAAARCLQTTRAASVSVSASVSDVRRERVTSGRQAVAGGILGARTEGGDAAHTSHGAQQQRGRRRPLLIGVAGGTASGKTCLCKEIVNQLSPSVGVGDVVPHGNTAAIAASPFMDDCIVVNISQDCFYRNLTPHEREDIAAYNFDHPSAFDLQETVAAMTRLKHLGTQPSEGSVTGVTIPQYDYVNSARKADEESMVITAADVIIFDGLLVFYWEELRNLFDLKIFVDTVGCTYIASSPCTLTCAFPPPPTL